MENLILIRQIEDKRDRGKPSITYPVSLSKSVAEQGLGEITKRQNLL